MNRAVREDAELVAEAINSEYAFYDSEPPPDGAPSNTAGWGPDLNPTQKLIFDDPTKYVLGHGERGSGKTIAFCHKMVRHAYENANALVVIIANSIRAGNDGIWHDLDTLVLPAWRDGMGLDYTEAKLHNLTKDAFRWIRNRFGGWSKLMLISIQYGAQVQDKIKPFHPSYIHIEEITNCDTLDYFKWPASQIGRRRDIEGPQQLSASCNPEGPSHWVYKVWWVDCLDKVTGLRKDNFAVYHVPIHENKHRLPEGYFEGLADIYDEIERRRLMDGEWIDRPAGDGLFTDYWKPTILVKGDALAGFGLKPDPRFLSVVSYDIGPMWPSITFEQLVMVKGKMVWMVYDEIDKQGVRTLYKNLAKEVISRMLFWNRVCKKEKGKGIDFMHITDESAINQWRAGGEGSYDAWEFEKEYRAAIPDFGGEDDKLLRQMRLIGCPKGSGSVEARVRLLQNKMYLEEFFVSAVCKNTLDMCAQIRGGEDGKPMKGKYVHKFDSVTYGMFKMEMSASRNSLPSQQVAPTIIRCGSS